MTAEKKCRCVPGSGLKAHDLVPLATWFRWRGRCRYCGGKVSRAVPVLEVVMIAAVAFAIAFSRTDEEAIAGLLFGWLLILLAAADLRYMVLPDSLTASLLASGLLAALFLPASDFVEALSGAAIGGGGFFLLRFLYFRFRGLEGLGLGDVKLMAGLGAWLGPGWLAQLVLIAAVAGLSIALLTARRDGGRIAATSAVPFGAYLCASAVALWCIKATGGWPW